MCSAKFVKHNTRTKKGNQIDFLFFVIPFHMLLDGKKTLL